MESLEEGIFTIGDFSELLCVVDDLPTEIAERIEAFDSKKRETIKDELDTSFSTSPQTPEEFVRANMDFKRLLDSLEEFDLTDFFVDFELDSENKVVGKTDGGKEVLMTLRKNVEELRKSYHSLLFGLNPLNARDARHIKESAPYLEKRRNLFKESKSRLTYVENYILKAHQLLSDAKKVGKSKAQRLLEVDDDMDLYKASVLYEMSQLPGAVKFNKSTLFNPKGDFRIYEEKIYVFITLTGDEFIGQVSSYDPMGSINLNGHCLKIGMDGWLFDSEEMMKDISKSESIIETRLVAEI